MEEGSNWSCFPSEEALGIFSSRLKPFSIDLFDLVRNPKKDASFLPEMASFLRRAPPEALQPYLDLTLLPLLLLLDVAVKCRSEKKVDLGASLGALVVSDFVAENMLLCLEEILKKCHLGSVDQMVVVLKKLTSGALLSPSEAAEEFRGGIIRCLRAMLLRLHPCSAVSCTCKQVSSLAPVSTETLQPQQTLMHYQGGECLIAFLQSEDASAAVGHLLSLLLQIAEVEAARGHLGSGRLRKEAFLTLRVLVSKVGTADALAFFLPGIVSRFSKALYASKSMITGAAGNTGSLEHAVRGLTEFILIVLSDDANTYGIEVSYSDGIAFSPKNRRNSQAVLDALRQLPSSSLIHSENAVTTSSIQSVLASSSNGEVHDKTSGNSARPLYVKRTKEWVEKTSTNVDKMLSATFPHLCVHPSEKVRKGLVDGITGLLSNCGHTLQRSKLMLLECLCVLVVDDSDVVSVAALQSLESLFMLEKEVFSEDEISEIFSRLIERLPIVVLGSDETIAVSHARRLLALMYHAGPKVVVDQLLCLHVKAIQFFDAFSLVLGHNSQYTGSVNNLILSKPLSVGYLLSISELKAGSLFGYSNNDAAYRTPSGASKISVLQDKGSENSADSANGDSEFPRMPPWFVHVGNQKLYQALAGILRLVSLSVMADHRSKVSLSSVIDIPLNYIQKLISELRMKEYSKVGWQTWYSQNTLGQLIRQTSTGVCILNEMIYGLSEQSANFYKRLFRKSGSKEKDAPSEELTFKSIWKLFQGKDVRNQIIYCVGSILHEYLSYEVWSLPIDQDSPILEHERESNLSLHFFRDVTMLHQVIIEGIAIFSITLGRDFVSGGFMHSCLYLLLQNLISSNHQIRTASDAALRVVSAASGYSTVGHLVLANADYIIDSLCRQLRHLDLNPRVPDVLAAMLSYIGAAHDMLPLLEEPMRSLSLELEVLGRHQHPNLTVPFLKAMREITRASRHEASRLPNETMSFYEFVNLKFCRMENRGKMDNIQSSCGDFVTSDKKCVDLSNADIPFEEWEDLLLKLNDMKRYRRIVGSLVGSCLNAATPLLGSMTESACLVALDIIEDVVSSLAKVEEAYKHEKEAKVVIEKAIQSYSSNGDEDTMDPDDDPDENRLLPAMNKIWPYLVLCIKNKVSVAVIRRCTDVLSRSIQISGGDFFVRRFHNDGQVLWNLLTPSSLPLRMKHTSSQDKRPILLPYRNTSQTSEDPMAEASSLKIQAAVLIMIADISGNKRSSSALDAVLKKISSLVVGVACSSVKGLQDASVKALTGLANMDPDLIWLLLADVYYTMKKRNIPQPPASELASMSELLPPPMSSKEYLYVQYGGEGALVDIDPSSVDANKLIGTIHRGRRVNNKRFINLV
ncbi:hypothetical protein J5N97_008283 [Dioscorea zingiberensis]|uniref:TTI1 N-terminal TPR domain-containing protein n=1 Tax=Dioscorea zingiberensis TaxID=325984 RepID=A0A9D5HWW5_9LILI|nr:hypothetical protein J5N97_008283 [Dioscorea zingiberensis]